LRGLHDLKTPGPKPKLTAEQQAELARLVEAGPDPARHGVVRWGAWICATTRVWAKRGTRPRAPRDQRYEWAYIFGAVCPQRRATAALVLPAADTDAMSMHLAEIGRRVAPGAHAALVIDGAGYHVAARLAVPRNITLIRLPPYAPELNPIENVWEYLRGNKLAITVFESYDDIVDKSCAAWNFFADDPEHVASITSRTWATVNP
jgi:hypothetical protein